MSALEVELTKALEDTAQLEERNIQLSQQLSELREKVRMRLLDTLMDIPSKHGKGNKVLTAPDSYNDPVNVSEGKYL